VKKMNSVESALTKKLDELMHKRSKIYRDELRKAKYELFSILMHEGTSAGGHYYCFVRDDRQQDCWWKLNDRKCTRTDWQSVREEAYGREGSNRNACCLFYTCAQTKA
jgi:ubiquitin C-terminal hydrolase